MKRLFRIGSGLFVYSIIPILSWVVLASVLHDTRIANVFSITYALQFVWMIFKLFFGTGANIRKEKRGDPNAVMNGIFWGTIFAAVVFSIPLCLVDKYISFFGQDVEFYKIFVIYSILQQFVQTLFSFSVEKLYFQDKEKLANIHIFSFNLLNFAALVLTALFSQSALVAVCVTISVLFVYVLALYVWQFQKFRIDFKFFKNLRYVSANIVSAFAMLMIYLFGFKIAFSAGSEYLVALNIAGLCTDTQWDTMGAIETVANVDISKNRYNYRKELKNGYFFTFILICTSILMCYSMALVDKANLAIVTVYLVIQIVDMLTDTFSAILKVFTQIELSASIITGIDLVLKTLRTLISVLLISPYCTEIGQIVSSFLFFGAMLFLRFTKCQVVGGRLVIRRKFGKGEKTMAKIMQILQEQV